MFETIGSEEEFAVGYPLVGLVTHDLKRKYFEFDFALILAATSYTRKLGALTTHYSMCARLLSNYLMNGEYAAS